MTEYKCPICGVTMPRDLAVFLTHGDQHIIDSIKKARPHWISKDGACAKCVEFYKARLGGNAGSNLSCGG